MAIYMKKVLSCIVVLVILMSVMPGTIFAQDAGNYLEKNQIDECSSVVNFKGTATTNELGEVIGFCYGSYHCKVKVEELLSNPGNKLKTGNEYIVCYGDDSKSIKSGDTLEVYGEYFHTCGPLQYVDTIIAFKSEHTEKNDYYVKKIEEKEPKLCTSPDPPSHNFGTIPEGETESWNFYITNCGSGTLEWTVSDSESWKVFSWLEVSPRSGKTTTEKDTIKVTIDTQGLSPGTTYTAYIYVTSKDGCEKTGEIKVTVEREEQKTGSLTVTISPSEVRSEAWWKLTSGPDTNWHSSGYTITDIPVGYYTIRFSDVSGWTKPEDIPISIAEGSNSESGWYDVSTPTCDNPPEVYFDKSTYYEGDTILATVSTIHSSVYYHIFGCDDALYYGGDASNGATISYTIPKTDASTCCNWRICFSWDEDYYGTLELGEGGNVTAESYQCGPECYYFEVCPPVACLEQIWIEGPDELNVGETEQWQAYGSYSDGSQKELTDLVTWTVDPSDVLLNEGIDGMFAGLKGGDATLKIAYEGKTATKKVTVVKREVWFQGAVTAVVSDATGLGGWWPIIEVRVEKTNASSVEVGGTIMVLYIAPPSEYLWNPPKGTCEKVDIGDNVEVFGQCLGDYSTKCEHIWLFGSSSYYLIKLDEEKTGSLTVTIEPSDVRSNARWKLTSGPDMNWHSSGDKIQNIPVGPNKIQFNEVSGWTKPEDRPITIKEGSNSEEAWYRREEEKTKALYVWAERDVENGETADWKPYYLNNTEKGTLFSFAGAHGINTLYLATADLDDKKEDYASFIQEASNRDIEVHALGGDKSWATNHEAALNFVDDILKYNKGRGDTQRFDGIHFDIECDDSNISSYKNLLTGMKSHEYNGESISSQAMILGVDTRFGWENETIHYTDALLGTDVDFITVMAYRDTANEIANVAKEELVAASNHGKSCVLGVETGPTSEPECVTFYEEGSEALENSLTSVMNNKLVKDGISFTGFAIHHYVPYKSMYMQAEITKCVIPSGTYDKGDKVKAEVTVKNTGNLPHRFYVGFSVKDSNGKWWDAPYNSIYLKSGQYSTALVEWTVDTNAPSGNYDALVKVWGFEQFDTTEKKFYLYDMKEEEVLKEGAFDVSEFFIILKPPFEYENSIKLVDGKHSTSICNVDNTSGKMALGTGASGVLLGQESASAVGLVGEKVYIPSDGVYKITMNATIKGKIVAWFLRVLPTSASGSEIAMGTYLFGHNEEKEVIFFNEKIATVDIFSDSFETILTGLTEVLYGVSVKPIPISANAKGIEFDGTYESSEMVFDLEEGYYDIYPYFESISVAGAILAAEQSYADFTAGTIYERQMFDQDPYAIEYIRINELKIEKVDGDIPPIAKFTPTSVDINGRGFEKFDATESKAYNEKRIVKYYWEFDGGDIPTYTSSNPKTPLIYWKEPGKYTVKLKVKDNCGIWSSLTTGTVIVHGQITTSPIDSTGILIECPVNATITDQHDRTISDDGTNEIPDANMLIIEDTKIFYLPADLTYTTDIDAYDTGTFNFTRLSPVGNDISITKFENIPLAANTKASVDIVPEETNYTMSIDYEGDGVYETNITPDVCETIEVEPILATIEVEPPTKTLYSGNTQQFTVTAKDQYSDPVEGVTI
ncbi:hypothetical protein C5S35_15145, partial [Candidatus Methanophagaceae archaeon]